MDDKELREVIAKTGFKTLKALKQLYPQDKEEDLGIFLNSLVQRRMVHKIEYKTLLGKTDEIYFIPSR